MTATPLNKTAVVICIQEIEEDGSSLNLGNQLTKEDLSFLHQAFVADSINNALTLPDVDIKLFYSPKTETKKSVELILKYLKNRLTGEKKSTLEENRIEVSELGPGRWGIKMDESFERCFKQGYEKVLFIGSRTPTLTHKMIQSAIDVLDKKDVAIGPTVEGRYYMLGFKGTYQIKLQEFDWKQPDIYSQVSSRLEALNLSWEEIQIWYAVEHPENIEYLAMDINQFRLTGDEETARETEKVLERILSRLS
ncbi:MAG: DUF2064 domain-containing protein [candidate division Zixibacteria bacterium]|nr:DUF2064 domain-containing protein [candidate division Zixibacteria bacterium]